MSRQSEKRKIVKGDYGYVRAERKRKILITAALLAVPLLIFYRAGLFSYQNDDMDGGGGCRLPSCL